MSSVKAIKIENTSDKEVILQTDAGKVTIPPFETLNGPVWLEESTSVDRALRCRLQLHD